MKKGLRYLTIVSFFLIVLYMFYTIGGTAGVIFLRIMVVLFTFVFLFLTIYRKEYFYISIPVSLFALFISFQRFLIRPEILSFFFLAVIFYYMERSSENPRLSLIIIPVCQILWANMHGLRVLGFVFLLLYLLVDLFQAFLTHYVSMGPKIKKVIRDSTDAALASNQSLLALDKRYTQCGCL